MSELRLDPRHKLQVQLPVCRTCVQLRLAAFGAQSCDYFSRQKDEILCIWDSVHYRHKKVCFWSARVTSKHARRHFLGVPIQPPERVLATVSLKFLISRTAVTSGTLPIMMAHLELALRTLVFPHFLRGDMIDSI